MIEDIDKLQKLIGRCKECKFVTCEQCEINWTEVQAIQNLIVRYKELEQKYSNKLISFQKEREEYEKCLEAEESYSKSLNNDIKSLLHIEPNNNFISKSKIQEKIKEYNKQRQKAETEKINDMFVNYIDCLQELLEKS